MMAWLGLNNAFPLALVRREVPVLRPLVSNIQPSHADMYGQGLLKLNGSASC